MPKPTKRQLRRIDELVRGAAENLKTGTEALAQGNRSLAADDFGNAAERLKIAQVTLQNWNEE